jgi:hypothetical protein
VLQGINKIVTECVDLDNIKLVKGKRRKKDPKPEEEQVAVVAAALELIHEDRQS